MKKVINKAIILSIFLLLAVGAKGSKSQTKVMGSHGGNGGLTTMTQTVGVPQGIVQPTSAVGGMKTVPGVALGAQQQATTVMQSIAPQPQLTQAGIVKLFDEEEHSREKLHREKEYSALQYVALECIHIIETLDRAQNKLGLKQLALTNNTNPNTVLNKSVLVEYPNISNVGGFGYYLFGNSGFTPKGDSYVFEKPLPVFSTGLIPMSFMTQERSQEIVAAQEFVKKWSNVNTYLNIRPDDQSFIAEFKASYFMFKNLVKKYLGQNLHNIIMQNTNRYYNEMSILIDVLNNQLLPRMTNNPNYKVPYRNLQLEVKNLGYNARYVFVMTCDGIYNDGNGMNPNQANIKAWAETGKN